MGKASSSKKIARAARAGGRVSGVRQRNLLFPSVVGGVLLAGTGLIVVAHADHQDDASTVSPLVGEHWHAAYGFYICGEFLPTTPAAETTSPAGIHTHGDGVVHIHPFAQAGAGENATWGTFLEDVPEVELTDDKLTIGEESWETGETKCGDETGELVIARWQDVQSTDEEPSLIYSGLDDLRFRNDGEGYTIAFVPEGDTDIPKPPTAANLAELGAVDADPTASSTTAPAEDGATTTAPPADGTTTAPPDETTTTAAP